MKSRCPPPPKCGHRRMAAGIHDGRVRTPDNGSPVGGVPLFLVNRRAGQGQLKFIESKRIEGAVPQVAWWMVVMLFGRVGKVRGLDESADCHGR